jgi:outer membrane receptor protein involved in Fe transport
MSLCAGHAQAQTAGTGTPVGSPAVEAGPTGPAAVTPQASAPAAASEIIVTGSRIARPTLDSAIPVTTVSAADLTRSGQTNIGDVLQRLPALNASLTQAGSLGGGVSIGTTGLNILNLRNLGSPRTLVLVDGQRHITSVEGEFLVDVNTIPTDLIERVDVVTGGSSAVYGSDAMAGVVNFVLKRNYEGFGFNAQGGMSGQGDRGNYNLSATYGKNFAEGRGNVTVDLEYQRADPLFFTDRPDQTGAFAGRNQFQRINTNASGEIERTFLTGVRSFGYSNGGTFIPYGGSSLLKCDGVAAACLSNQFPRVFLFQGDGSLRESNYGRDFRPVGSNNNQGGDGATLEDTGVLQPGYSRYVANVLAHYDVSDAFQPYIQGKFVRVDTFQVSSPTFSQGGPQGVGQEYDGLGTLINVPISLDNAFLTPQALNTIRSQLPAGSTFFNMNRNNVDLGSRGERDRRDTWRIVGGVQGRFNDDWHYDVNVDYGHVKTNYLFTNNRIEDHFFNAIDAVRNASGQIVCRINQTAITDPACAPLSLLGPNGGIQDPAQRAAALAYVNTTSQRRGTASELDINGNLAGDTSGFFNLPGGPLRFAVGGEYRRERAQYAYDALVQSGDTFLNSIAPFAPPTFAVKEGYAELEVPLLKERRFFQELTLNGAGRVSSFKGAVGTVWAYNAGGIYSPLSGVRFRVNFSHSVRSPTLGDSYTPASQNYALVDDPCDPNFINTGSPTRAANCRAAGVPAGYDAPQTRAGSLEILSGGNPNLKAETSRSWTYGLILQPRFARGLAITVDYYDIKINNVISAVDAQTILNDCYDASTLNNAFCQLIKSRNADGTFQLPALLQSSLNFASERSRGIDLDISYNRQLTTQDRIAARFIGNWVRLSNYYQNIQDPTVPDRIKGELGNPIYQFSSSLDWTHGKVTFGYALRYIGRQSVADWEQQHAVPGIVGTPYDPNYVDQMYYPHAFYHDLRIAVQVERNLSFYAGVDNLTNKLPPYGLLGIGGTGLNTETTSTDTLYDNVGRSFYAGVRFHF